METVPYGNTWNVFGNPVTLAPQERPGELQWQTHSPIRFTSLAPKTGCVTGAAACWGRVQELVGRLTPREIVVLELLPERKAQQVETVA
jgi:hypothetical protein